MFLLVLLSLALMALIILLYSIYFQFNKLETIMDDVVEQVEVYLLHEFGEIKTGSNIRETDTSILDEEEQELKELDEG
jgi:hypothetical protein